MQVKRDAAELQIAAPDARVLKPHGKLDVLGAPADALLVVAVDAPHVVQPVAHVSAARSAKGPARATVQTSENGRADGVDSVADAPRPGTYADLLTGQNPPCD